MAQRSLAQRRSLCAFVLIGLAGCSTLSSTFEPNRFDYRSANSKAAPKLEVPPDLVQLEKDNRFSIPKNGVATASGLGQQGAQAAGAENSVAPNALSGMHVERDGNQRWLVVPQSPETLWPQLEKFWRDAGFTLKVDSPQTGVMETDWAENRAKIPQDFIRRTLGKVFNSLYSTGEFDKFRTRLERQPDGSTEIYVSHRGTEEVLTGAEKETSRWTPRSDPGLEAAFLSRLMVALSPDNSSPTEEATTSAVANAQPQAPHAKLVKDGNVDLLEIDEGFERAWRRVGLALDRAGFTVEDRDRSKGVYFVRYFDTGADGKKASPGFFSRLFSSKDKKEARRYRISIIEAADAQSSQVKVLTDAGEPETSSTGTRILKVLVEQLK